MNKVSDANKLSASKKGPKGPLHGTGDGKFPNRYKSLHAVADLRRQKEGQAVNINQVNDGVTNDVQSAPQSKRR